MTISKIYVTSLPGMRITVGDHGWQIVTAKREDGAGPGRGNDTRLNQSRVLQMRDSRPCASLSSSRSTTSSTDTSTSTGVDNSALVTVSNVTMDPGVFFPYESGTITVTLSN